MEKAVSKNEEVMFRSLIVIVAMMTFWMILEMNEKCFHFFSWNSKFYLTHSFQVKGKIDAYRMFKAKLLVELSSVFPKEISHYRALRGDERVNP